MDDDVHLHWPIVSEQMPIQNTIHARQITGLFFK